MEPFVLGEGGDPDDDAAAGLWHGDAEIEDAAVLSMLDQPVEVAREIGGFLRSRVEAETRR